MADAAIQIRLGPADDGRRMSLDEFRNHEVQPGYLYELGRGVIEVAPIPDLPHGLILQAIDDQIYAYKLSHPGRILYYGGGDQAKMELPKFDSERHPDRSLYTTPPPRDPQPWDRWTPTIAIEVVSSGDRAHRRDHVEKREEYLAAGVTEYWIVDPLERSTLALRRYGDTWREQKLAADETWRTDLLPDFTLELAPIFAVLDQ